MVGETGGQADRVIDRARERIEPFWPVF